MIQQHCISFQCTQVYQETNPFTYVEINGLKISEPSSAYAVLWEAISGHDTTTEGKWNYNFSLELIDVTPYRTAKYKQQGGIEQAHSTLQWHRKGPGGPCLVGPPVLSHSVPDLRKASC